jgi:hypothetical protein
LIRRSADLESGVQIERGAAAEKPMPGHLGRRLPFAQRLTCTVAEACEVTGLGRTKVYEFGSRLLMAVTRIGAEADDSTPSEAIVN